MPMIRVWQFCALNGQCWISAVDDWQTMITGVIALIAAGVAYCAAKSQVDTAKKQLEVQQDQYWRDKAGRLRAARASLPLVLSGICEYAESSVRTLRKQFPLEYGIFGSDANIYTENRFSADELRFPSEYIDVLERMIEFSSDNIASRAMEALIREVQIFQARWRSCLSDGKASIKYLGNLIYEACVIRARAEILFNYARGLADDVDEADLWARVDIAMMALQVDHLPVVSDPAKADRENRLPPGEADRPMPF